MRTLYLYLLVVCCTLQSCSSFLEETPYNKIKNNHSYIDNIYKAYSIPYRDDLGSFSEALGIYDVVGELKDAIISYKKELNNETKIL